MLVVADNGIGFNKKDINDSNSLGLNIIRTLVEEDLKGIINIIRNRGTRVEVKFPFFAIEEVFYADSGSG